MSTPAPTAHLQLRNALMAHLLAHPPIADGRVYASRTRPIAQEEPSAVTVRLLDSEPTHAVTQASDWRTVIEIACTARADPSGDDADTAADALLAAVYARLRTFTPAALGSPFVDEERTTLAWDHDADDTPITTASLRIAIEHRTPAQTLTPWM